MSAQHANRFQRAFDYIEQRLASPLTLAEIAAAAHLSEFHFARMFRAVSGTSVMDYVRRRRLQHAVDLIGEPAPMTLLEVAIACGFGSNEAFTGAFRREYGVAPSTYRRNQGVLHLHRHRRLQMSDMQWETPLQPTFVELPAFYALGMAGDFEPGQTDRIGALWDRFSERMHALPGRIGSHSYGICCPLDNARESDRFSYIASVQVASLDAIPEGFTGVSVAAARYAVFSHQHGLGAALARTVRYVFGEWLPASGYHLVGPDFEYYDERFEGPTGAGEFFIYLPVAHQ